MSELVPNLQQIEVTPEKLILDPNNPRLITKEGDEESPDKALDLLDSTISRMRGADKSDAYKIGELENSIVQNGWWPVDCIFVRKIDESGHYLVLEGNRRVTAIRNLRNTPERLSPELAKQLESITVMEIVDDLPEDRIRQKITYLLGVRHHGSLIKWSPFAQAHNIYRRYLELTSSSLEDFTWEPEYGGKVANALSISADDVKGRLRVYRAMEQIAKHPLISDAENGGMKGRYYSVCAEVVLTSNKALKKYISQSQNTFLFDDISLERIINLCHFDLPARRGTPINNPQEWRKLANILEDPDEKKREQMLSLVEGEEKQKPSIVYAERAAELQKLRWDTWLTNVLTIVRGISLEDDLESNEARETTERLVKLIQTLENHDQT